MSLDFKINLQLFSEEKTEKATPKRRREAREKGQVLQSREINSAIILIFVFLALKMFGYGILNKTMAFTVNTIKDYASGSGTITMTEVSNIMLKSVVTLFIIVGPIALVALVVGVATSYMQVGFLFTMKSIEFKLSKLNPIEGFKRLFSKRSIVELIKSFIKIFLIGYVIYSYGIKQVVKILNLMDNNVQGITKYLGDTVTNVAFRAGGVLVVLAAFDYLYQWWDYEKNLKMSKQEIKEEFKQTDGNPQIKSKIKEKQRQIAMRRMMQDVPKADVIITNPTHYAVALKYDKDLYDAPYVLAKGQDLVAQKIKDIANDNSIPIVEDKPLARTLHATADIGQVIPEELYQTVAEVLAYVYSLKS
ncbi:flagellar biosynthetic protein FlhB [Gottschalkia purinilytica]|uniref:Flagellar biosynthetic protein FlhB n=1 Tax=Gottschalkia purinilytica TaxID=1503 RepID=A0A0L0WBG6_GOTPU|nr:flagellar biosynthetic protein FlhB [Gottschalkia purinilytica]